MENQKVEDTPRTRILAKEKRTGKKFADLSPDEQEDFLYGLLPMTRQEIREWIAMGAAKSLMES